jgi:hypothetical protein
VQTYNRGTRWRIDYLINEFRTFYYSWYLPQKPVVLKSSDLSQPGTRVVDSDRDRKPCSITLRNLFVSKYQEMKCEIGDFKDCT